MVSALQSPLSWLGSRLCGNPAASAQVFVPAPEAVHHCRTFQRGRYPVLGPRHSLGKKELPYFKGGGVSAPQFSGSAAACVALSPFAAISNHFSLCTLSFPFSTFLTCLSGVVFLLVLCNPNPATKKVPKIFNVKSLKAAKYLCFKNRKIFSFLSFTV